QRGLAVDDPGIQVGHRHGRRAHGCLAVYLGVVLLDDFRLLAYQPLPADREAAVSLALVDPGLLQQRQRAAACAEEHEPGLEYLVFTALLIANGYPPAAALALAQALDRMAQVQLEVVQAGEVSDHVAGQGAEVDVRTILYPGGGDGLIELALLHDQRHPFGDLLGGLAVLHIREQVMGAEQFMPLAQEGNVLFTPDEALMSGGVDELGRRRQYLLLNQVGPELQGHLEVGIDRQRAVDSDAAIIGFGGVVQLTVTGAPSAGIVS